MRATLPTASRGLSIRRLVTALAVAVALAGPQALGAESRDPGSGHAPTAAALRGLVPADIARDGRNVLWVLAGDRRGRAVVYPASSRTGAALAQPRRVGPRATTRLVADRSGGAWVERVVAPGDSVRLTRLVRGEQDLRGRSLRLDASSPVVVARPLFWGFRQGRGLTRFDPRTGAPATVVDGFVPLAVTGQALWDAPGFAEERPDAPPVDVWTPTLRDPSTGAVRARAEAFVPIGGDDRQDVRAYPSGEDLWMVTDLGFAYRVGAAGPPARLAGRFADLAVSGPHAYGVSSDGRHVTRFSAASAQVQKRAATGMFAAGARMEVTPHGLWLADRSRGGLVRVPHARLR